MWELNHNRENYSFSKKSAFNYRYLISAEDNGKLLLLAKLILQQELHLVITFTDFL